MQRDAGSLSVARTRARIAPVIACALGRPHEAQVAGALRGHAEVRVLSSFAALRSELLATVSDVSAVVMPPKDCSGTDALQLVREIARQRPRTAIVIHTIPGDHHAADLRALAMAGAHQFVFAGVDDFGVAFRTLLESARQQCAAEGVMRALSPSVPPKLHPVLEIALNHPQVVTSVTTLANSVGVRRTTLSHWCAREHFLVPEELLVWARLALAAYYLESTACTVEAIAQELSYPSDTALRNSVRRYLGCRAMELRTADGLERVVRALNLRLQSGTRPN